METKTYYTATALIDLPGMPRSKTADPKNKARAIQVKAAKEGWESRRGAGRGGTIEYSITSLPPETRAALATANTKVGYEEAPVVAAAAKHGARLRQSADQQERLREDARAQSMLMFSRCSERQQRGAHAKLAVIKACHSYIADHRLAKTSGQQTFCHEFDLGRIDVAPWVREEIPRIHPATLRGWIREEHELGMTGLVDCYGNRKDQSKIETWGRTQLEDGTVKVPMAATIVSLILKYPHITEKKCNESLRALLPAAIAVSDKSVKRYMDKWKAQNQQEYALAINPDNFKNCYQPAFGSRSEGITGPNQRWEIDATPADLLLTDGRHKIIGLCDVGPRRLMFYVTRTERARDNCFAVRRGLLDWGVPAHGVLVVDQGSPYKTEQFKGLVHDLDIERHECNAYSGDEKPHIERAFHTLSHDLIELLPGYCGHDVAERKKIEAQKSFAKRLQDPDAVIEMAMTGEELQAFCDRWAANYHDRKHSELGRTPNQVMAQWPHPIRVITDERALDVLLYEPVRRGGKLPIIGKKGIRVDGGFYIHEALGEHIGEYCRAFQEPISLGKIIVHIRNQHGAWEYLCIAEDPERTGISRFEVATATRHLHAEHKKEMARHSREAKKALKGVDVVSAVLALREREAAESQGNVVPFPNRTIPHESAGLTAAAAAAAALESAPIDETRQFNDDAIEAAGRRWLELTEEREIENKVVALPTAARPMFGTDLEKYQWLTANPVLQGFDDARWIGWYEDTTEYQLMFGYTEDREEERR